MNNVALFFGSFSPIHNGHIHIAKKVLEKMADKIEFVISPKTHLKIPKFNSSSREAHVFKKYKNVFENGSNE